MRIPIPDKRDELNRAPWFQFWVKIKKFQKKIFSLIWNKLFREYEEIRFKILKTGNFIFRLIIKIFLFIKVLINFDPANQRRVRDEILKADLDSLSISLSKSNCVSLSIKEIRVFFLESVYDLSTPPCISIYSDSDESGRLGFPMISIETKSSYFFFKNSSWWNISKF